MQEIQTSVAVDRAVFAVTMEHETRVHLNLGQRPFMYQLGSHIEPEASMQLRRTTLESFKGLPPSLATVPEDATSASGSEDDTPTSVCGLTSAEACASSSPRELVCQLSFVTSESTQPEVVPKLAWLGLK